MAMSGFEVACVDAIAIAAKVPLVSLQGGAPGPVRAYNSNGLGIMAPDKLAKETDELLGGGFKGVKLRLGYDSLAGDIAAVRTVRGRLPAGVELMGDYNQALSGADAPERGRAPHAEGGYWIEGPIPPDDYRGAA